MKKGQYQLFLGLVILILVGVSIGILYYNSFKHIPQINQTTTTTTSSTSTTETTSTTTTTTMGPIPTMNDLFSGKAVFVKDQSPLPISNFAGEAFAVNRLDLGPQTILVYYRCNINVQVICLSRSDDDGTTFSTSTQIIKNTLGYFSVAPSVVKFGDMWYMVYEEGGYNGGVFWASSIDGINWIQHGQLFNDTVNGTVYIGSTPSLFVNGNQIYVFYAERIPSNIHTLYIRMRHGISLTALSDPVTVFLPTQTGWNTKSVSMPRVIRETSTSSTNFYLFFEAATDYIACSLPNRYGFGVAKSSDLIHWTAYLGNPVRMASSECGNPCDDSMEQPFVRYDGSIFVYHNGDNFWYERDVLRYNYTINNISTICFIPRNASYISDTFPSSMCTNETQNVSITFKNTGNCSWTFDNSIFCGGRANNVSYGFKLGSPGNSDPFASPRQYLNSTDIISQNQQKTFIFQIKAPSTPGLYQTDWQMLQELVTWFGDVFSKSINVNNC